MRSNGLRALYRKKAREVDQQNGGIPEGEVGKVERKVEDYGEDAVVFGWGRIADIRFFSL